jgi:hypothetical protein
MVKHIAVNNEYKGSIPFLPKLLIMKIKVGYINSLVNNKYKGIKSQKMAGIAQW